MSNNSTSQQKKRKFETNRYMVVFEELLRAPEARENFRGFLKLVHCEEPLQLIDAIDSYRTEHKKLIDNIDDSASDFDFQGFKKILLLVNQLENIVNTFGLEDSIEKFSHYYMGAWTRTLNLYHLVTLKLESISNSNKTNNKQIFEILEILNPSNILEDVETKAILDLKYDEFPRYARSNTLHLFLVRKGEEYTRRIAINIANDFYVDIRFKPKDFESQLMTDKDVYFAYTLSEDTPDWKELTCSEKPNFLQTFVSKTVYSIGPDEMKGMRLFKLVMHLPYAVEDVWATYCDMNTRFKLDHTLMKDFKLLRYIPPHQKKSSEQRDSISFYEIFDERDNRYTVDKPPLAIQIGALGIEMHIPLLKHRDLPHTMTSLYDPSVNCYMNIGHTCKIEESLRRAPTDRVKSEILFNYMFFGTGEKSTRFIHTVYTDLHVPLDSDFVLSKIWKNRSKQLQASFEELLAEKTKGGTISIDKSMVNDHFKYFTAVEDNAKLNRKWYRDYLRKKNQMQIEYGD
ncbi:hypothetical protein NAEGRDRAFT_59903 [Naegleria gruberi]|uniref:RGS domain-containing protein n=1 Tax=Naegleria gruberi TaxID=5762 RepID=D2W253_NAEGR|nr:uncharacterized protein NAEGRDRAFT_59903 [Naegleria gruberi]EFC36885.1 hypothetical protein NAEGRDRAFT_59903 [Naegleria gruberi]|eukprot:XP_002669629.1 hypothetical protein NAEGRDRAFT_59903 [Naegleria gruberi strain NEG-M]